MGIHTDESVNTQNTTQEQATPNMNMGGGQAQQQRSQGGLSLTGATGVGTLSVNRGNAYVDEIVKNMKEYYAAQVPDANINIHLVPRYWYSPIIVSFQHNGKVYYHTIMLAVNGEDAMTVGQMMQELERQAHDFNYRARIYTPDDAVNAQLQTIIRDILSEAYGVNKNQLVSTDAMMIPKESIGNERLPFFIAVTAYNACFLEAIQADNQSMDVNIADERRNGVMFRLNKEIGDNKETDALGNPVRADWKLDLSVIKNDKKASNIFADDFRGDQNVVKTTGYVDAIPIKDSQAMNPQQMQMQQKEPLRFHPHIVVTSIQPQVENTINSMLLGLISSFVMTGKGMYIPSLLVNPKETGALNLISDLAGNGNKPGIQSDKLTGDELNLSSGKHSTETIMGLIDQMFTKAPILSVDVPTATSETVYTSILAAAASSGRGGMNAKKMLVEKLSVLTDGIFPKDYPLENIFLWNGITVPNGYYNDKTGVRDIRSIDLAKVTRATKDVTAVSKWAASDAEVNNGGMDQFTTKLSVLANNTLAPEAVVTGKSTRVTFTPDFLYTLVEAAKAAGFEAQFEEQMRFMTPSNLGVMTDRLRNVQSMPLNQFVNSGQSNNGFTYNAMSPNVGNFRY